MTSFLSRPMTDHRRNGVAEARIIHADGHVAVLTRPAWEIGWRDVDHIVTSLVEHPPSEAPPQRDPGAPPVLQTCLHPPTVIIEVVKDGRVHRWWPYGDCRRDPAVAEALEVAEIVAAAFPHCAYFPVDRFGMGTGRLRACLMADGPEPLAAVEVLEDLQPGVSGDARAVYEADRQSERVRMLTLDGRRVEGRDEVVAALKAGALGNRWLRVLRATGEAGRVTVHGQLNQVEPGVDPDSLNVAVVFSKEGDGEWRITEWRPEQRLP
ncbi:MAG: hypothetical protein EON89_15225 [Brevundimonas sp.]|nr:MAG: hypothetical protein EON89_15225 [Brevundimonas sp.]